MRVRTRPFLLGAYRRAQRQEEEVAHRRGRHATEGVLLVLVAAPD